MLWARTLYKCHFACMYRYLWAESGEREEHYKDRSRVNICKHFIFFIVISKSPSHRGYINLWQVKECLFPQIFDDTFWICSNLASKNSISVWFSHISFFIKPSWMYFLISKTYFFSPVKFLADLPIQLYVFS